MNLNEKQQTLADAPVKQLTIGAAMAGTGKSTTMVARAKKILTMYPSGNLLIISFTKLSARDLREKLSKTLTKEQMRRVITGTFHSVMGQIIKDNAMTVGLNSNFSIIDESSTRTLYRRILDTYIGRGEEFDQFLLSWTNPLAWSNWKPGDEIKFKASDINMIVSSIGALVNMSEPTELDKGVFSNQTIQRFRKSNRKTFQITDTKTLERIVNFCYEVFKESILEARKANVITYDQILFIMHLMVNSDKDILGKFRNSLIHTMVDEAQDTNALQFEFINSIENGSLTLVGDVHQSIYSFRGGRPDIFLSYLDKGVVYPLETNYRSYQPILDYANNLIKYNTEGADYMYDMVSAIENNEEFAGVTYREYEDDTKEADAIVNYIKAIHAHGIDYSDIAILVRSRMALPILNRELQVSKIPINDTTSFADFMKSEVMVDMLNFLKILVNPKDIYAFIATLDRPKRGIGEVALRKIELLAIKYDMSVIEFILSEKIDELTPGLQKKVAVYRDVYLSLLDHNKDFTLAEAVDFLLRETGYEVWTQNLKNSDRYAKHIDTLKELVATFSDEYYATHTESTLFDVVNAFTFDMESFVKEETPEGVTIATMHGAKGLEWDYVFLPSLEEQSFELMALDDSDYESERRLMYVALTRARKGLFCTSALSRVTFNNPNTLSPANFLIEAKIPRYNN